MNFNLLGKTVCRMTGECKAGNVHSLDADLELCVCTRCGQGWIRDVDPWRKVERSLERLKHTLDKLQASSKALEKSCMKLNDVLKST